MRTRAAGPVALLVLAGCGRIGYAPAPQEDAGPGSGTDASGLDASGLDASATPHDAGPSDASSADAVSPVDGGGSDSGGTAAECASHPGYELLGSGCFRLVLAAETYADAELVCERDGGHLAVIESAAEQDALHARWPLTISIGLLEVAGTWTWITGEVPTFLFWDGGEPDTQGSCSRVLDTTGRWDARSCMDSQRYLCEIDGRPATVPIPAR